MRKQICLLLGLLITTALLAGCGQGSKETNSLPGNLMAEIKPNQQIAATLDETEADVSAQAVADFAVRLFQQTLTDAPEAQNALISPLSVLLALSMTANGAADNTLAQMEAAFNLPMAELNNYLLAYANSLPQTKNASLHIANSIWLKEDSDITAKPSFLQTNADYYGADVFQLPFDNSALNQINSWVKQNTDGMIEKILDNIPDDEVMYLINAIAFEAEWDEKYDKHQISRNIFTTADGQEQTVEFMRSEEKVYLQDEAAQGFVKYYAGRDYAFVALLPDEGVELADYISSLTGEKLLALLNNQQSEEVRVSIPKFKNEFSLEMNQILQNMGITDAFDEDLADFSAMADIPAGHRLYIDQVLHKTFIEVDEKGTKAAATTAVTIADNSAAAMPKTVYLTRPFVYLLIDCQNNLPLFIGTVNSVE